MKTNYAALIMEQDDVEVSDAANNRMNVFALLLGLVLPLVVFLFILVRNGINAFSRSVTALVVFGRTSQVEEEARSASAAVGR